MGYSTMREVWDKIDWEGGLMPALEYGILTCEGVPALLGQGLVARCEELHALYNEVLDDIEKRLAAEETEPHA